MIDIKYYRKMRNVDRLAQGYKNRPYNLLEHSYMVAMLFRHFASLEDVSYDINVFDLVLYHDVVETISSDLPWPIKNFSDKTKEAWGVIEEEVIKEHFQLERYSDENLKKGMTNLQYSLFKACDILDLYIFVKEEIQLGNNTLFIKEVKKNCETILNSLEFQFPKIKKFIEEYAY